MNQKYVLTDETIQVLGKTLHRIKAISDFGDVKSGDLGGFIESEKNLDITGNAWVYGDASVYGDAIVYGNARVYGNASVYGDATVFSRKSYMVIGPIGSRDDFITFTRDKKGIIYASVGCFSGTLDAFRKMVAKTHRDNMHAKAYMISADLAEARIDTTMGGKFVGVSK